ncbi:MULTISPECIES: aldehyde reductase [unclassified Sphingomonas]|uniref:SDR family oxidoreductase n=1 Tax=unclassified Sphingomonas TaxID=196159 RepID=UPI000BD601AE|nr:MAG: epimerase [Sphingomonas sp. 12-62-6]OYX38407.1 MAG: epimerase [Sphingomonas sp. 32-62-10]
MSGQALVTGGSGYIGGFIIRKLIEQGWTINTTIRSLAREAEVRAALAVPADKLRFFAADLLNDAGWADAVAGCSHVVHVASPLPSGAVRHEDDLIVPAREGALRALRFAKAAGVKRVVMTSSVAAIAYGHGKKIGTYTEADWTNVNGPQVHAYAKSKTLAERAARDWMAAEGAGMEYVSVNPAAVLGPVLSADFSSSVQIITRLLSGSLPGLPNFGFGVVDVRDVADLHVRALTADGIDGERFIASGPFMMMKEVAAVLRDRMGGEARKVPTRGLPDFVLQFSSLFDPTIRMVTGELGKQRITPSDHARDVLGWVPRPAADTIVDTARSLIDKGVIKV